MNGAEHIRAHHEHQAMMPQSVVQARTLAIQTVTAKNHSKEKNHRANSWHNGHRIGLFERRSHTQKLRQNLHIETFMASAIM